MVADLSMRSSGLVFRSVEEEGLPDVFARVVDKFPQMEDVHVEGRRFVEVSVELFVQLMALAGYEVVNPHTEET